MSAAFHNDHGSYGTSMNENNGLKSNGSPLPETTMVKYEASTSSDEKETIRVVHCAPDGHIVGAGHGGDDDGQEEEDIDIQVRNVVCNYTIPLHIDLRRLALRSGNVTFDRGRGVLLKQKRNPSCYVKVYSSGKIYIVGCRSEAECMRAARGVARMVQRCMDKLGSEVRIRNYRICNVLATCKMPFGIKIEEMAQRYPHQAQYEPELSVGLVWRSTDPKATLRIHTTGSITVTGASSEADVMRSIELIYPIVKLFRCALRLRNAGGDGNAGGVKRARKRPQALGAGGAFSLAKRQRPGRQQVAAPGSSGIYGNKMYFSDEEEEDELFEEGEEDDDDDLY